MIEFILVITLFFMVAIFVIIFLRKDIFYTGGNGEYVPLSQGVCQNGTRYSAYRCETLNQKGCLDKFGNLTFDIELRKEKCIVPPPSTSSVITGIRPSTFSDPVLLSRGICLSPDGENCIRGNMRGTRKVYKDCSKGCIEKSISGIKIFGGVDLSLLEVGQKNNNGITRVATNLFNVDGKLMSLSDASLIANTQVFEEECDEIPRCEEEKCVEMREFINESCSGDHFSPGTMKPCKDCTCEAFCLGYQPQKYSDLSENLNNLISSFSLAKWTCNKFSKIYPLNTSDLQTIKDVGIYFCVILEEKISSNEIKAKLYGFGPHNCRGWLKDFQLGHEEEIYNIKFDDGIYYLNNALFPIELYPFDNDSFVLNSTYKIIASRK